MSAYADRLNAAWTSRPLLARRPTVVSLFAGCGGSSLGYTMAGFDERLAVEWDEHAAATFKRNFPGVNVHAGDIGALEDRRALEIAGVVPLELDVLDGSPPCQGFSTAGARRESDPRNRLFEHFVRLLSAFKPRAFVMENVTGLVKGKARLVFAEIYKALAGAGYTISCRVLDARWFGCATYRRRVIFLGLRMLDGPEPTHPAPWSRVATVNDALDDVTNDPAEIAMLIDSASRSSAFREWDRMPIGVTRAQLVRDRKGPNCKKIDPSRPAPTIAKNEGILGLRGFMHWHERRRFTVREFARMQSFPDAFDFGPTSNTRDYTRAVGQIGNSVPPMLMRSIALALLPQIEVIPSGVASHDPLGGATADTIAASTSASSMVMEST